MADPTSDPATPDRPSGDEPTTVSIFNEDSLRAAIVSVWGEHGAHAVLFDHMRSALAAEATEPPPDTGQPEPTEYLTARAGTDSSLNSPDVSSDLDFEQYREAAMRSLAGAAAPASEDDERKPWTFDVEYVGGPQPTDYGTGTEWDGGWQWAIYDGPHEIHDAVLSGWAPEDPTPVLADLVADHNRAVDGAPSPLKPRGFGPNFHWAAAPQALEHHVATYRAKVTRLSRELRWLEDLLTERNGQVARGEWPPAQPPEGSR